MSRASEAKFVVGDYVRDVDTGIVGRVIGISSDRVPTYLVSYLIGGCAWYDEREAAAWEPRIGEPVSFGDKAPDRLQSLSANVTDYANGVSVLHIPTIGTAIATLRAIEPITPHDAAGGLTAGDRIQVVDTPGLHRDVTQGDIGVVTSVDGADIHVRLLLSNGTTLDQHCSAAHLRRASIH